MLNIFLFYYTIKSFTFYLLANRVYFFNSGTVNCTADNYSTADNYNYRAIENFIGIIGIFIFMLKIDFLIIYKLKSDRFIMSEIFNWLTGWFYNSEEDKTNKDNSYGTFSPKRPEHPSKPIKKIVFKGFPDCWTIGKIFPYYSLLSHGIPIGPLKALYGVGGMGAAPSIHYGPSSCSC